MRAALELFVEQGFAATRIQEIAKQAGVSKGTVYLYFESKEALLEAVVRESVGPVLERGQIMVDEGEGSAAELIRALLRYWWSAFESRGATGLPKLIYSEGANYPKIVEIYMAGIQQTRSLFERAVERGVAQGEFRPVHVPTVVKMMLGQVVFAMIYKHSLARFDPVVVEPAQFLDALCDLFLRGLLPRNEVTAG